MNKSLREDLFSPFDESKYGELIIHDVVSYDDIPTPKLYKFKKSNSDSNVYEYFNKKLRKDSTQFIIAKKSSLPYFHILNSKYECARCTNKINIIDYKISIVCPLCFLHINQVLKNFIIK